MQKMEEFLQNFTNLKLDALISDELSIDNQDNKTVKEVIENTTDDYITNQNIDEIKQNGFKWVKKMLESNLTYTKPGSISYLLYGAKPSEQSINIKMGRHGEWLSKELIKKNTNLDLLICGVQKINNKKKDIDLLFKNEGTKTIYYRELKGNIELDTEKLPATISKCKEIENSLKETYPDYTINCGILNWSVYNRKILTAGLSNIKSFENGGIKIDHMGDFLEIIGMQWNEADYYNYFREIAKIIDNKQIEETEIQN